jgi:hypothetical protein
MIGRSRRNYDRVVSEDDTEYTVFGNRRAYLPTKHRLTLYPNWVYVWHGSDSSETNEIMTITMRGHLRALTTVRQSSACKMRQLEALVKVCS